LPVPLWRTWCELKSVQHLSMPSACKALDKYAVVKLARWGSPWTATLASREVKPTLSVMILTCTSTFMWIKKS
jgi:hypothetical protein